jgi:hypothetical protein
MKAYICQFCGKDTSNVEYDYLNGYDHLSCTLEQEIFIPLDSDKKLFTVSNYTVLSTPNDQELGAKVRKLYYENNS